MTTVVAKWVAWRALVYMPGLQPKEMSEKS